MPFSKEYRAYVEEQLSAAVPIQTRAMFGGVAIYADGLIFALIDNDRLYFKAGDLNRADYEAAGMGAFHPYDTPATMPYWELPPGILENPEELKVWVDKSIAVAVAKKKPKRK